IFTTHRLYRIPIFPYTTLVRSVLKNCSLCTPCKVLEIGHEKAPACCKGFGITANCGVDSYKKLPITGGDELGSLSLLPLSISKIAHIFGTTCVFINSDGSIIPRWRQGFYLKSLHTISTNPAVKLLRTAQTPLDCGQATRL